LFFPIFLRVGRYPFSAPLQEPVTGRCSSVFCPSRSNLVSSLSAFEKTTFRPLSFLTVKTGFSYGPLWDFLLMWARPLSKFFLFGEDPFCSPLVSDWGRAGPLTFPFLDLFFFTRPLPGVSRFCILMRPPLKVGCLLSKAFFPYCLSFFGKSPPCCFHPSPKFYSLFFPVLPTAEVFLGKAVQIVFLSVELPLPCLREVKVPFRSCPVTGTLPPQPSYGVVSGMASLIR